MKRSMFIGGLVFFWVASFFLHLAWENWQIIFYRGMANARHADAVWVCTRAAFGDANIALGAYAVAALTVRNWNWPRSSSQLALLVYLALGIVVTVIFEHLATDILDRWHYSDIMPVIPVLGTGLLPLLQWLFLPLVSLALMRMKINSVRF